ncbi:MAG: hypothetical protein H6841_05325 [Planctomycetes bacterium]|nr:hypothetical protein [Planctomycetota bacterium]MCB9935035.1 hypothetical protein [Planctomycetota bacterium]
MKIKFGSMVLMALFAIVGLSMPLSAQCSGGGCGGGSASGGCPGGGCPSSKKVGRVGQPANGGAARVPAAVDPKGVPAWQKPSSDTIESASTDERPIIVYFPSEDASDGEFYGEELAKLSQADALFVKIPYSADREASPWTEKSVVPTSRLLSDNPSREYDIPVGKATVLVCDWFGNEYFRTEPKIKAEKLSSMIGKVKEQVKDNNSKLQKNLDKAKQYVDANDRKAAVKALLKNFKEGLVGMDAQENSIRLYHEIMDAARAELSKLSENADAEGMKAMAKDLKNTDVEKEIDEAIAKLS